MVDEMKLAPGGVNFVSGLVDAEVFAGRLKAPRMTGGSVPANTIFETCDRAVDIATYGVMTDEQDRAATIAVIQAIIARTPSPATVVELTRILRDGGVDVPEATFD